MYGECVTIRGSHHVEVNKPCQDTSGYFVSQHYSLCIVADGHGGEPHYRSGVGSQIAVEATLDVFSKIIFDIQSVSYNPLWYSTIPKKICDLWAERVKKHNSNCDDIAQRESVPLSEYELLYGTTLIIGCMTEDACYGFRIGDGSLIMVDEDGILESSSLLSDDYKSNKTKSLCDCDAADNCEIVVCSKTQGGRFPKAVVACTDGIDKTMDQSALFDYVMTSLCGMHSSDYWYCSVVPSVAEMANLGTDDCSLSLIFNETINFNTLFQNTFGIDPLFPIDYSGIRSLSSYYTTSGEVKGDNDHFNFIQTAFWKDGNIQYSADINRNVEMVDESNWTIKSMIPSYHCGNKIIRPNSLFCYDGFRPMLYTGAGVEIEECIKEDGMGSITRIKTTVYEGSFVNCIRNGEGKEWDAEGRLRFVGSFSDGQYHGFGLLYRNNSLRYRGLFNNGNFDGEGVFYCNAKLDNHPDNEYPVVSDHGLITGIAPEWDGIHLIYLGGHRAGLRDGDGIEFDSQGNKRKVKYLDGKIVNVVKITEGNVEYSGGINEKHEKDGFGKQILSRGSKKTSILLFEGSYKNGMRNGFGTEYAYSTLSKKDLLDSDRVVYSGNYYNGLRHGKGQLRVGKQLVDVEYVNGTLKTIIEVEAEYEGYTYSLRKNMTNDLKYMIEDEKRMDSIVRDVNNKRVHRYKGIRMVAVGEEIFALYHMDVEKYFLKKG